MPGVPDLTSSLRSPRGAAGSLGGSSSVVPPRWAGAAWARAGAAACRQPARGAGAAVAWSSGPLARLPVQRVATAPAAVLAKLDAVGRIALRLLRLVVPAPALRTGERDCDSDSGCHFLISLRGTRQ